MGKIRGGGIYAIKYGIWIIFLVIHYYNGTHRSSGPVLLMVVCFNEMEYFRQRSEPFNIFPINNQRDAQFLLYIQGVPGGMDKTSGECSLC